MRQLIGLLRLSLAAALTVSAALVIILTLPFGGRGGRLFHAQSRLWARSVLAVCGVRVSVRGLDHLDASRNYVYVSNHASLFDIPVIIAAIPDQIRIMYKRELEAIPIFGWGLKWGPYVAIDRRSPTDAIRSIEQAAARIRGGASVLLYAEGTRTTDGRLQPFKRGAFNLAVRAGVPVVPVTINGTFTILPKHSLGLQPGDVTLILDTPLLVAGMGGKDAEHDLMERVHASIAQHYRDQ